MELGALVCTPAKPQCPICPVSFFCKAFDQGTTGLFPVRNTKKKVPLYHIACAAVVDVMGNILVTKRPDSGMLPGFWEFPGGKCEKGESNEVACIREVYEETGLTVTNLHHLCTIDHAYSHFRIRLALFGCPAPGLEVRLTHAVDFRWIPSAEMKTLAFPAANRKCMPALLRWLQNQPDNFFSPPCRQSD
ncbi:(deoxy)nucleoside triphosphate pyrophosphohydrolase [Desulfobotulus sp. H1]|uniref:8-oxo-dGTP diphosphatase n=2 Tax=Desulfobotulus pelophilus TaxID=2823377 RepID=A0ABT3N8D3_9BACT|nr:(deoxy)nucleoside triphosphate pyrophosphohydrolase [Desulfobotulus pelophilus]